jgi:mono/diheme cytochrome c family protein
VREFFIAMTTPVKKSSNSRKTLFGVLFVLILISVVLAVSQQKHDWRIPEGAKLLKNPLERSALNVTAGHRLYRDNCADCHGQAGKGDGPEAHQHDPLPSDLSDRPHAAAVSDGELFYRISEGRKPMPAFKKRLNEDQRWQLVIFVRTLSATSASLGGNPSALPSH